MKIKRQFKGQELKATRPEIQEKCAWCGSTEFSPIHHEATLAVPECDYYQCGECDHQWGHA